MKSPPTPTSIKTAGGRYVDLLNPTVDTIELEDIVVAAKRIVRFTGHSRITLAEHSCLVHDIVVDHFGVSDPLVRRAALLHDAHEVYVGDASSPLKLAMREVCLWPAPWTPRSDFDKIEGRLARAVAEKFSFSYPHPKIVKEADLLALAIEARDTWGEGTPESWGLATPIELTTWHGHNMTARYDLTVFDEKAGIR